MSDEKICSSLNKNLADSYVLLLKTQNYHWNVKGSSFFSLHKMFEMQYNDIFEAIDLLAERIRSLGFQPLGTFESYLKLTSIQEKESANMTSDEMIKDLIESNENLIKGLNSTVIQSSGKDEVTTGIVLDRVEIHQKNIWMLKSAI